MDKTKIKYNVHTFIDSVGELGICVSPVKGKMYLMKNYIIIIKMIH